MAAAEAAAAAAAAAPPPGLPTSDAAAVSVSVALPPAKKSEGFGGETKEAKMARYTAYVGQQDAERGLAQAEVARRRAEFGLNALDGARRAHARAPAASRTRHAAWRCVMTRSCRRARARARPPLDSAAPRAAPRRAQSTRGTLCCSSCPFSGGPCPA